MFQNLPPFEWSSKGLRFNLDLRQLAKIGRAPWISRQGPWTSRHGELSRVPPQSKTARQKFYCTDFHYKTPNLL